MKTETQTLIILILGLDSIISLIGLLLIIAFIDFDVNVILALITMVNTPVALLGGFLTGKTWTEVESETIKQKMMEETQPTVEEDTECDTILDGTFECTCNLGEDEGA